MLPNSTFVFSRNSLPMLVYQTGSLDSCLLSDAKVAICRNDLHQSKKGFWVDIEVLLQLSCDRFDLLCIGCVQEAMLATAHKREKGQYQATYELGSP